MVFSFFEFFCYFIQNFLPHAEYERNSRLKFFFLFFGLPHPVLAKIMPESGFLIFLNFFAILFRIFFPKPSTNGIRDWNFFLCFSAYLIPFWQKIMPKRGFLIFWIFLLFFSDFSFLGRSWTEFGTKFFFPLSQPISSRCG